MVRPFLGKVKTYVTEQITMMDSPCMGNRRKTSTPTSLQLLKGFEYVVFTVTTLSSVLGRGVFRSETNVVFSL